MTKARVVSWAVGTAVVARIAGVGVPLALVAGCGDDASEPVTITFLRHDNTNYRIADNEFFAAYMAEHPNVKIVDNTVTFNALDAMLNGDLKSNQFPYDLVLVPPSRLCAFADNVTDVPDDVVTLGQAQNTFFEAPLAGSTCGDKLKGLPVEYNLEYGGVVVNLDKYRARFQRDPAWPDWDAFINEAAMLTEYNPAGEPMANGLDIDPNWSPPVQMMLLGQILQRGGKYWGPTGDLFNFQTAEARDSLTQIVSWVKDRKVFHRKLVPAMNTSVISRLALGATGYGWNDPAQPLAIMGYVGTWGLASTRREVPAGTTRQYGFYAVPPMFGKDHRFVQDSGWSFAVPKTSKNPKVAWDVARSLALSPEAMRKWSATTGALPALRANGTEQATAGDPVLAQVQPLLEHGRWRGYIPSGALQTLDGALLSNFAAAVDGTKDIAAALADMERVANEGILAHRGK